MDVQQEVNMGDVLTVGGQPNDLINLRDAARLADEVHPTTVRRWIGKGMLKAYRRGPSRVLYVSRAEVVSLMQPVESGGAA
ncbi:helix-turn-helix domain-containing protein [Nocardia otitidiscaviarum]|uniref:helix-turn-helix domain-containing protein n=1 Tax=Nocardia otitidiscaviarum TaxID=1823 RepID=UPI001894181C|nr:helix-turn-helix domain-containing protein [Nocardia otitidiscaviarum]MBF6236646.1 helix-turn-helix domain-containing protein [Nocardia otitidiscaviarum]